MPIFPTTEETVYFCKQCKKYFILGNTHCAVLHLPGTCCHYGDTEVSPPEESEEAKEKKAKR
jgi:hypothetical protein